MRIALCAVFAVGSAVVGSRAQAPPNFSGAWSVVPTRSVWYDDQRPVTIIVFGERFTAEQVENTLTITIESEGGFKWTYRLDGVATRNVPPGPDGPQETSSRAAWREASLVITTTFAGTRDGTPGPIETTRRLTLNDDGTLFVEAPWGRNGAMIGSVYSRAR